MATKYKVGDIIYWQNLSSNHASLEKIIGVDGDGDFGEYESLFLISNIGQEGGTHFPDLGSQWESEIFSIRNKDMFFLHKDLIQFVFTKKLVY
jgi:hypothetical protein